MTVKELRKRLKGYPMDEVRILIEVYDSTGYPKQVNCEIKNILASEQGGEFFTSVVLEPDYDELEGEEPTF